MRIAARGLDEDRRASGERRLERGVNACGCGEGAAAGLLYLAGVLILASTGSLLPRSILGWVAAGGGLVLAICAGRMFGTIVARLRFLRALNDLERAFLRQAK